MNVKVGALAEIARIDENGRIVLDTKGAVILDCGTIRNVKIIAQKTNKDKSKEEGKVINQAKEIPNAIDREKEPEKEEKPEPNIRDNGADDMIV